MTRLLKTLALAAAIVMLAIPGYAQSGGIKEPNLSPELDLLVNNGMRVYNNTGSTLTAGELVYVCGWAETVSGYVKQPKVCAASNAAASTRARYILPRSMVTASSNDALRKYRLTAVNTFGATVGDPVYLSTAGGWTLTAPGTTAVTQTVGRVAVVSASIGEIQVDLESESDSASGASLIAGSVAPDKLGINIRASTALAAGDLVYLSSYSAASSAYIASIADANVANAKAQYVATGTIGSGSTGTVYKSATIAMVTTGGAVGDPIYLTTTGTTGNTMTLTPPSTTNDKLQIVGRVTVVTAGVGTGRVLVDLADLPTEAPTTEYRAAASLGAATLNAGTDAEAGTLNVYPATTARGKLSFTATNQTGNTAVTVNADAMGQATTVHLADPGVAASYVMQSTAANTLAENDVLHSVTAGAASASKAVIVDASKNVTGLNVVGLASIQGGYTVFGLTDAAAAAAFAKVAIPAGTTAGGYIAYCYEATNLTDYQARCGTIPFSAVNKAGAITCAVGTVGAATEIVAVSTGTLTATTSCADASGGVLDLKGTADTSLTVGGGYVRVRYRISALAPSLLVITPQ